MSSKQKHIIRSVGVTELGGGSEWAVVARIWTDDGRQVSKRLAVPVTQENRELAVEVATELATMAGGVWVEGDRQAFKAPRPKRPVSGVIYAPCREEDSCVERCHPHDAQFWGVYWLRESGHLGHHLSQHLADVKSRREAEAFAAWLAEVFGVEAVADAYAELD